MGQTWCWFCLMQRLRLGLAINFLKMADRALNVECLIFNNHARVRPAWLFYIRLTQNKGRWPVFFAATMLKWLVGVALISIAGCPFHQFLYKVLLSILLSKKRQGLTHEVICPIPPATGIVCQTHSFCQGSYGHIVACNCRKRSICYWLPQFSEIFILKI